MSNGEISDIYDSTIGVSDDRLLAHLSALLDVVYRYRVAFAAGAVLLERVTALKSFSKSRRPYVQKQIDLFRRVARGEFAAVVFERSGTVFNGIDRFRFSHRDDIEVPESDDEHADTDPRYAVAVATFEIRSLRALAGYETGVLEAHLFTKTPVSAERAIREARQIIETTTTAPTSATPRLEQVGSDLHPKDCLRASGATVTLTSPQYIEQIKEIV